MGAILGGADDDTAEKFYRLGETVGLAFQLQDDFLDVYGDPAVFGKKIGGDITSNKKTFLLIKALETAVGETRAELLNLISAISTETRRLLPLRLYIINSALTG